MVEDELTTAAESGEGEPHPSLTDIQGVCTLRKSFNVDHGQFMKKMCVAHALLKLNLTIYRDLKLLSGLPLVIPTPAI